MANPTSSSFPIPIFYGNNYDFWSIKMTTFLMAQDLWDIVEKGCEAPPEGASVSKDQLQKDAKALYFIQQALSETVFPRIIGARTAKEAWDILREEFQGSEKVRIIRLQTLRRDFENSKMKNYETVQEYCGKLKELVNQMRAYGDGITDQRVIEKILVSLTIKYNSIVTTIEGTKDLTTLSISELIGSLEAYEKRLMAQDEDSVENAFQSKVNIRSHQSKNGGRSSWKNKRGGEIIKKGKLSTLWYLPKNKSFGEGLLV
ncbi:hypothetical protein ACJRO7_026409 [Eucalyptus globulus]|uniref:DUF4219 domain-containing protein n=1 Tax=Eucalyptus globulus TaxID=34317 RepID=A0ABD3K0M9_EUCGL